VSATPDPTTGDLLDAALQRLNTESETDTPSTLEKRMNPDRLPVSRSKVRPTLAIAAAVAAVLGASAVVPARAAEGGSSFEIYGFAMLDYIQDTKRVDPAWLDAFRPSKIATPEGQFGTNGQTSVSVKQSRFGVKGNVPTGDNTPPINFKFEFDFFGTGADAGQTTIRLRHVYGEWGGLLAGQTNSVFMDIDIFPDVIDYWGPAGMVFVRTPQLRWTGYRTDTSELAIAIEKPSNDIDPGNIRLIEEYANATVRGNQRLPDLTAHFRYTADWGHAQIAGILRQIGYEYQVTPSEPFQRGDETGWGVNLTGLLKVFEKDKVQAGIVYGNGIATYMNDGGMDLAPTSTPNPALPVPTLAGEAVPLIGVSAYYGHYWNDKWESSIGYSYDQVTNTNFQATTTFHKGEYASVNLIAYPASKVMIGAELMYGKRTDNAGVTGDDVRFQLSVKYDFGTKL
jgi:hypothetical protein